jgi:hypothetical protein
VPHDLGRDKGRMYWTNPLTPGKLYGSTTDMHFNNKPPKQEERRCRWRVAKLIPGKITVGDFSEMDLEDW